MNDSDFNPKLIRLPLDYVGEPELAEVRIVLPSYITPESGGGDLDIGIQLLDKWGFHLPGQHARLELGLEGGRGELPSQLEMLPEYDSHHTIKCRVSEANGVFRVRAKDLETGIEGLSNPGLLQDDLSSADHKLYWGDIHAHRIEIPRTKLSDPLLWSYGPATVHEFYRYARDAVHLDFTALTDHDYALTVDEWRQIQEGAQYYNQPGRFVTFLGYEWCWNDGPSADHGHRNILYRYDDMPLVSGSWHGSNTPQDLFNILRGISRNGCDILSIPHHPARLANRIWHSWESMDPHFERLIEIYSLWGSSEQQGEPFPIQGRKDELQHEPYEAVGHFIQDGLRLGKRFGFLGGSESHDGRATNPVMHGPHHFKEVPFAHRAGMAGVWARRKTRDSLWSSLWNRRTIATTGARIIVDFDIDNQPIGETVSITQPPHKIRVSVHGTAPIDQVVVLRNNQDWYVENKPGWDCTLLIEDIEMPSDAADWYYVRVIQADGNMAWTSPIWVEAV